MFALTISVQLLLFMVIAVNSVIMEPLGSLVFITCDKHTNIRIFVIQGRKFRIVPRIGSLYNIEGLLNCF